MNAIPFVAEWAVRSSVLVAGGAALLWLLRVKNASVRLAAWTAVLCGSLAIPLLTAMAPKIPVTVARTVQTQAVYELPPLSVEPVATIEAPAPQRIDWARLAAGVYLAVACALLLRILIGFAMGQRLLRRSRGTGRTSEGIRLLESDDVAAPVTMGILRPVIVVPTDWREWELAKLDAVLAHEQAHVRRRDAAVQLLSAVHRALVWHSPMSWFLHSAIVRTAEDASDDAAVAVVADRTSYAEFLLEFMQRGVRAERWQGVAMARYGSPDRRIHRILDGPIFSRGVTRWSVAAIVALGAPLGYLAAAAHPQQTEQAHAAATAPVVSTASTAAVAQAAPARPAAPQGRTMPPPPPPAEGERIQRYVIVSEDNISGSWSSGDMMGTDMLRQRFGNHFVWFRRGGQEYVSRDTGVLDQLKQAMEPQKDVNRMQGDVNNLQSSVNAMQAKVNALQNDVNAMQNSVNRRQDLVNRIQHAVNSEDRDALIRQLEAALNELRAGKDDANQNSVNRKQNDVNAEQAKVNAEQAKVNAEQAKVNEQQHRVSAEYSHRIQDILDSAVRNGKAQPLI